MIKKKKTGRPLVTILIFLFTFSTFSGHAQKGYEEGFVVLTTHDTLYGAIKDRKPDPFGGLFKKIKFKGESGGSKYGPKQLLTYKKGNTTYETVWISDSNQILNQNYEVYPGSGAPHFLKVVQKGFLTYYHWEFEDEDSGYIDYIGYFKRNDSPDLVRVNQGIFGLKRRNVVRLLGDCPELTSKIMNKTIKHPLAIVMFYNHWRKKNLGVP